MARPDDDDEETQLRSAALKNAHSIHQTLRKQSEWLRVTLTSIADAVISTDAEGRVSYMNSAAESLTGWRQVEASGRPLPEVVPLVDEQSRRSEDNLALRALREGIPIAPANRTLLIAKGGAAVPVEGKAAPIRGDYGDITGCVLVLRDVTEQRRLEEHLLEAQKMEAIGRLAAGIAHDFNNTMTIITGLSELLLTGEHSADERRESALNIHAAGTRAASLTQQIMAFSRKQLLMPRVLNLNAVVRDMAPLVKALLGAQIEFVTQAASDLGDVKVDPTQIGRAILSVAANARDAMRQSNGGRLTIATANVERGERPAPGAAAAPPGRYAMLSISDNGDGMPEEVLGHVFEPFFTTKAVGQGTGLGLAMVYGIVRQSGGLIDVSSEIGVGTTFRIYLPLLEESMPSASAIEPRAVAPGGESILLVEDEETLRMMTKRVLTKRGYHVLEAADGLEGVAVAETYPGPIHLLVTDLIMPQLSGRELAERLTARTPGLRVLLMSGYTEDVLVRQGVESSETNFLQKPFSLSALTNKVREVLDTGA